MLASRTKSGPAGASSSSSSMAGGSSSAASRGSKAKMPELDDFIAQGDFTGATTLLDFQLRSGPDASTSGQAGPASARAAVEWLAYAAFHNRDYARAIEAYEEIIEARKDDGDGGPASSSKKPEGGVGVPGGGLTHDEAVLCKASCLYFQGKFAEAEALALSTPDNSSSPRLRSRLLLHLSHRLGKEQALVALHSKLGGGAAAAAEGADGKKGGGGASSSSSSSSSATGSKEDALCRAALHYARGHYQEAADIYKRLLLEGGGKGDDAALHAYVAACYYKLDYYDISLDIVGVYLQSRPTSPTAINLKACNHFRLYNAKAAEAEIKALADQGYNVETNDLMRHNLVVFRNGEGALRVLPSLVGVIPEARLNLVVHHLRNGAVAEAYALVKDEEPSSPQEFILKAVVLTVVGQRTGSREHLKTAQQYFNVVGASPSECDTIPGRQAMASCFFLARRFEDVLVYLSSVKPYLFNDDDFSWNYGITLAAVGNYKEAEEALALLHNSPHIAGDPLYIAWLARCFIMNKRPRAAWELYLRVDSSTESVSFLQLIANDCYRTGQFYWAAKAFDVLERMDPSDGEYWEGKRGACMGVFQAVIAGTEARESLRDVAAMLRSGPSAGNPQVEYMLRVMDRWAAKTGGL